jgi:hypothetical protein
MNEGERMARRVAQAIVQVLGNPELPGKYADVGIVLALEIASYRKTLGHWALIRHGVVAERAASHRYHVSRLIKALVGPGLLAVRLTGYYATASGPRRDQLVRSEVGPEAVDILEALALVVPDWEKVDPRPDHAATACPDCGGTEFLVQKWCKGCGALVAEYTEGAGYSDHLTVPLAE